MSQGPIVEEGFDPAKSEEISRRFLAALKIHQEAVWAVVCHGRIVGTSGYSDYNHGNYCHVHVYRPEFVGSLNVETWWDTYARECDSAVVHALESAFPDASTNYTLHWIVPVPDELADFAAKHSSRPMPSRYQSTAVDYAERDGIVWLTPPERVLYDLLKAADWTFIPQPAMVLGDDELRIPDFLIFWGGRAEHPLFVEIDSDTFHSKPSERERDESKERRFQALGFGYIRFSAKSCLHEPMEVAEEIKKFCVTRWGPSR
jgi:hypothetical protein